ncbi:hypothetical protein [Streptomyces griseofuscus]|uniref:hypothetical protein n=1 Tax=Streptomyces griseofuscus TaxID=146922 RepID=UPI0033DF3238
MTPRERWLQRMLHARGVRPVGHADPADEDQDDTTVQAAPVVPVQPKAPAPGWSPAGARRVVSAGGGRLPAPGQTITLGDEDDEQGPEVPVDGEDQVDADPVEDVAEEEAPATSPAPTEPVAKVPANAKPVRSTLQRRAGATKSGKSGKDLTDDPSLRIAVFNLSAAAVGYMLSLAEIVNTYLRGAEHAARGVFAFVLAAAAALGAWWITRHPAVRLVLPYALVTRPLVIAGCAEVGRRIAPVPVAWLNQNGARWGLGPDAVSLLITTGGISFALWWGIDRRLRRFHWLVRWFFRIPLATTVVCTLRYGNPIH